MFLSVIIPTRNRSHSLHRALSSLCYQNYPADLFEVIVVDNGSADNTTQTVRFFDNSIKNLRYYYDATPGLHVGRHLGMKVAMGDILAYADDDIEAFPTWLSAIAEAFQDKDVVLVGGKTLPKFASTPPTWIQEMWHENRRGNRILSYLSLLDLGNAVKTIDPRYVYGCNFAIRKAVLLEAGGFHPDAMPPDLVRYRGDGETYISRYIMETDYKTLYHPDASVYHVIPVSRMTEEYFRHRAFLQGISDSYTEVRRLSSKRSGGFSEYVRYVYFICFLEIMIRYFLKVTTNKLSMLLFSQQAATILPIKRRMFIAYRKGWQYHQIAIKSDRGLYEHVMRRTYLIE